jgi:DnaK suppressor protein
VSRDARERLEAERRRTSARLARLTSDHADFVAASADSNADDEHDPEGATIAFERSQVATLARQARAHLEEVDTALARLASGDYGVCAVCGRPIPPGRLEARPTAVTCVACAGGSVGTSG